MKFFKNAINVGQKSLQQTLNKSEKYFSFQKTIFKFIHINDIPSLKDFIKTNQKDNLEDKLDPLEPNSDSNKNKIRDNLNYIESYDQSYSLGEQENLFEETKLNLEKKKSFYLETYGCQMNENDSEIISTILIKNNFSKTENIVDADVILTNTCAIRESAEEKVWKNIMHIKGIKKRNPHVIYGVLGCMAERMKEKILEKSDNIVDLIIGPDAYRDLPHLVDTIWNKELNSKKNYAINVQLSLEETYADIIPVRKSSDNIRSYLSIMRGCNNMCSFCIVPFTRGRERSRPHESIFKEVEILRDSGIKEITLLGQNVNSFLDETYIQNNGNKGDLLMKNHKNSEGFKELFKIRNKDGLRFTDLIHRLSLIAPEVRFRFTSPHPKDFPEELIDVIKESNNICKQIHLPAQSGNSEVLKNMRRYYSREAYLNLVDQIRQKIPKIALSSDFISGFCGETDSQFDDTLTLIEKVGYDMAYLFAYSMREKTHAYHNLQDNVPEEIKKKRLNQMIDKFREILKQRNISEINSYHLVLVEGKARKNNLKERLAGRTDTNKLCVFSSFQVPNEIPSFLKFNNQDKADVFFDKYISVAKSDKKDLEFINFRQNENYFIDKISAFTKDFRIEDSLNIALNKKIIKPEDKILSEVFYGFSNDKLGNFLTNIQVGDYVIVKINDCSTNTLFGTPVCKINSLKEFFEISEGQPYYHLKMFDNPEIYNNNIFSKDENKTKPKIDI